MTKSTNLTELSIEETKAVSAGLGARGAWPTKYTKPKPTYTPAPTSYDVFLRQQQSRMSSSGGSYNEYVSNYRGGAGQYSGNFGGGGGRLKYKRKSN